MYDESSGLSGMYRWNVRVELWRHRMHSCCYQCSIVSLGSSVQLHDHWTHRIRIVVCERLLPVRLKPAKVIHSVTYVQRLHSILQYYSNTGEPFWTLSPGWKSEKNMRTEKMEAMWTQTRRLAQDRLQQLPLYFTYSLSHTIHFYQCILYTVVLFLYLDSFSIFVLSVFLQYFA